MTEKWQGAINDLKIKALRQEIGEMELLDRLQQLENPDDTVVNFINLLRAQLEQLKDQKSRQFSRS